MRQHAQVEGKGGLAAQAWPHVSQAPRSLGMLPGPFKPKGSHSSRETVYDQHHIPRSSPAGPPGATFFATRIMLPDPTSRIDSESHVNATSMPRVLAVEQVDTEEAPWSCRMFHPDFLG